MAETTLLRREDAPLESTWNREAVYASWAAWDADYELALAELPALRAFAGRLGEGPARSRWNRHLRRWPGSWIGWRS